MSINRYKFILLSYFASSCQCSLVFDFILTHCDVIPCFFINSCDSVRSEIFCSPPTSEQAWSPSNQVPVPLLLVMP